MGSSEETHWNGERAITLRSGELTATFLPDVGMTGVSLERGGDEYLSVPGGVAHLRAGHTAGLPLLAPWANRLAGRHYRVAGRDVDLEGLDLSTDDNGLPMHGLLVGRAGWNVGRLAESLARLSASIEVDAAAFPFPHRIELSIHLDDVGITIDTTIVPTGSVPVPIAIGWHPYLRLPRGERAQWRLSLPDRRHLTLDEMGIPNGGQVDEGAEAGPIGARTFDDLYELGLGHASNGDLPEGDRRLSVHGDDGCSLELRCGAGYPYAQVWVPAGRDFLALEPMAAPTNALLTGAAPHVQSGDAFTARFSLAVT